MADGSDPKKNNGRRSGGSGLPSRRSIHGSGAKGRPSEPKKPEGSRASRHQKAASKPPKPPQRVSTRDRMGGSDAKKDADRKKFSQQANKGKKPKKSVGRKIGLGILFAFLIAVILGAAGFMFAYATIKVPEPGEFALAQKTTVYYADGETELGTFSEIDRTIIDASKLPDYVGHAVVASEDRTFFTNSGIDLKGIARALINNLRGGDLQGASTLSQQYVERYYLDTTTSYVGKAKEAILALKINQQQSKDQILENYLNTIYFGRGAYGIEEAAKNYFGHSASDLTLAESALLAGIIPAPSAWDPAVDPDTAKQRFQRVLDLMVEDGWISPAEAAEAKFPEVKEPTNSSSMTGTTGYLMQQIRQELSDRAGLEAEALDSGGYKIISTLNKDIQKAAIDAVNALPDDHAPNLQVGLSAVNPENGEIYAEYAGRDYQQRQLNTVTQDIAMAGSTMKPIGLLAYMEAGGTLQDMYNGNSGIEIADKRTGEVAPPLANYGSYSFGYVDMLRSTALSINTSYVEMNNEMGPEKTRDMAVKLGYPKDTVGLDDSMRNILGSASPRNIDIALAFSTIASGGMKTTPHIVRTVEKMDGTQVYQGPTGSERVVSEEDISAMFPGLEAAAQWGSADKASAIGRPVAAKTGSSEENRSAQFVGFIPQMVTVVSMYQPAADGSGGEESITPFGGVAEVTGGTWPATIWQDFMLAATANMEVQTFDWVQQVNRVSQFDTYVPPTTVEETTEKETEPKEEPKEEPSQDEEQPAEPEEPGDDQPGPENPPGGGDQGNQGQGN